MRLGDADAAAKQIPTIPSGSVGLNIALGIGGYLAGELLRLTVQNRAAKQR